MEQWKYVSENTTDYLSLHDCECEHIYYADNRVIMKMEWMEILESHPNNMFPEAHQSGQGIIELVGPQIVECIYDKAGVQEVMSDVTRLDFRELEIIEFEEILKEGGYENSMYMIKASKQGVYDNVALTLRYKSSIVKFNELQDVSWFVNFGKK